MIASGINTHVGSRDHVTVDTCTALASIYVVVVSGNIVDSRVVTAATEGVAFEQQSAAMWVVAIGTGDPLGVHATLEKGTMHVDLIEDLPVVVIESRLEQTQ